MKIDQHEGLFGWAFCVWALIFTYRNRTILQASRTRTSIERLCFLHKRNINPKAGQYAVAACRTGRSTTVASGALTCSYSHNIFFPSAYLSSNVNTASAILLGKTHTSSRLPYCLSHDEESIQSLFQGRKSKIDWVDVLQHKNHNELRSRLTFLLSRPLDSNITEDLSKCCALLIAIPLWSNS